MIEKKTQKYIKLFQVTLAASAVYLVLKYLLPLVLPFVISYFLCRWFYPWAQRLAKKTRLPLTLWAWVLVGTAALLVSGLLLLAGWYLFGQVQLLMKNSGDIGGRADALFDQLCTGLAALIGGRKPEVKAVLCAWGDRLLLLLEEKLPPLAAGFVTGLIKGVGALFIILMIAIVGAVLLIKNKQRIRHQVSKNIFGREIYSLAERICEVSAGFFRCQAVIIAIVAVILSVGLRLAGNRYGVLIGAVTAVLDALPVIGSGTILVPWALVSVIGGRWKSGIILLVLYILCTVVREVLEPRLMGDKLGINEFYMLMATFIGIALFGVWGIFLGPLGMIMILEVLRQMEDLYENE